MLALRETGTMSSKGVPRDDVIVAREGSSHRWRRTGGLVLEELEVVKLMLLEC